MNTIKNEIISLSKYQVEVKANRKTVTFNGERIMSAQKASWQVLKNRVRLRHLFIAYAILKGKEPVYPTKVDYSQSLVDKLVEQYSKNIAA